MYWSPVFIPVVDWNLKHILHKFRPASQFKHPIVLLVYVGSKEALQWMPVYLFKLELFYVIST